MCILNEPLKSELVFILVGAAKDAAVKHIKKIIATSVLLCMVSCVRHCQS